MRITGGLARGIVLDVPKKGEVRPATDFVRERIFGRLSGNIKDKHVLDCFAGTGAYGLEALSHGASHVCFLEKDPHVIPVLQRNCEKVCKSMQIDVRTHVTISQTNVFHFNLFQWDSSIDYIFFDPPYRFWKECLKDLCSFFEKSAQRFPECQMIIEYPSQFVWTDAIPWIPVYPICPRKKADSPEINLFKKR